jgi:hypothetical protein
MKKVRNILCGTLLFSLAVFGYIQSNVTSKVSIDLKNILSFNQAQAEDGDHPCMDTGFKTWNGGFWYPDGKDCDCNTRTNVVDSCQ